MTKPGDPVIRSAALSRPTPWSPPLDGHHYEAVVDEDWIVPPIGAGRCRFLVARRACRRPAVATLLRPNYASGTPKRPWDYCADHLYGRWIENGRVMHWRLVRDAD